jgi:hypothetical protein
MDNINQALAGIENRLKSIDSARMQVEKVTESGHELTVATHQLAEEVRKVADVVKSETSTVIADFSIRLSDFEKKLDISVGKGQENIADKVEYFKKTTKDLEELTVNAINVATSLSVETIKEQEKKISEMLNNIVAKFSDKLIDFEKKFSITTEKSQGSILGEIEKFKKTTKDLETVTIRTINETTSLSVETIRKQENKISATLNNIAASFSDTLVGLEKKFSNTTEKSQESIIDEVVKFKKTAVELEAVSNNSINEIKLLSVETILQQEVSISKTIEIILSYSTEIKHLIDQLSAMELPDRLNNVDLAVSAIHEDIRNIQNDIKSVELNILNKNQSNFDETNNSLQKSIKLTKQMNSILIISAVIVIGLLIGLILK